MGRDGSPSPIWSSPLATSRRPPDATHLRSRLFRWRHPKPRRCRPDDIAFLSPPLEVSPPRPGHASGDPTEVPKDPSRGVDQGEHHDAEDDQRYTSERQPPDASQCTRMCRAPSLSSLSIGGPGTQWLSSPTCYPANDRASTGDQGSREPDRRHHSSRPSHTPSRSPAGCLLRRPGWHRVHFRRALD